MMQSVLFMKTCNTLGTERHSTNSRNDTAIYSLSPLLIHVASVQVDGSNICKPMIVYYDKFMSRVQMDLIDLIIQPDGDYKCKIIS